MTTRKQPPGLAAVERLRWPESERAFVRSTLWGEACCERFDEFAHLPNEKRCEISFARADLAVSRSECRFEASCFRAGGNERAVVELGLRESVPERVLAAGEVIGLCFSQSSAQLHKRD